MNYLKFSAFNRSTFSMQSCSRDGINYSEKNTSQEESQFELSKEVSDIFYALEIPLRDVYFDILTHEQGYDVRLCHTDRERLKSSVVLGFSITKDHLAGIHTRETPSGDKLNLEPVMMI
ncbi:hypothetical protein [Aquimarina aquimarini]|uniref:hypothetical protein n=1 Tax=Aquimarina aquimarini TaxID=1191734 RepID=UPI000D55108B|nr:hypothetical protein [Aquimarina aquimarini]